MLRPPIKAVPSFANFNLFLNIAAAFFLPTKFLVSSIAVLSKAFINLLLTFVDPSKGDRLIDSPLALVKVVSLLSSLVIASPIP